MSGQVAADNKTSSVRDVPRIRGRSLMAFIKRAFEAAGLPPEATRTSSPA